MTREELIAALERAEGPSRELDAEIVAALYPQAQFRTDEGYDDPIVFHAEPLVTQKAMLPRFTASIDAALTLVPDGRGWNLSAIHGLPDWFVANVADNICPGRGKSPSPAIALCIAALTARGGA